MSNEAINWARGIEGLKSPEAFVLWVICDRYNEEKHTAWPSIKSIAKDTRLATRTVSRALATLEGKGLISKTRTISAKHEGWASNTYFLPTYDTRSQSRKQVVFREVWDYEASLITFRSVEEA